MVQWVVELIPETSEKTSESWDFPRHSTIAIDFRKALSVDALGNRHSTIDDDSARLGWARETVLGA